VKVFKTAVLLISVVLLSGCEGGHVNVNRCTVGVTYVTPSGKTEYISHNYYYQTERLAEGSAKTKVNALAHQGLLKLAKGKGEIIYSDVTYHCENIFLREKDSKHVQYEK